MYLQVYICRVLNQGQRIYCFVFHVARRVLIAISSVYMHRCMLYITRFLRAYEVELASIEPSNNLQMCNYYL